MLKFVTIVLLWVCVSASSHAEKGLFTLDVKEVGQVQISIEPFVPAKHKLKYCGEYACLLNGAPFFGSDGQQPKNILKAIRLIISGNTVSLDSTGMVDPGVNAENIGQRLKVIHYWGDFYKVSGRFSDGAGSYIAQWIVSKHGSIRTFISDMETAMDIMTIISPE